MTDAVLFDLHNHVARLTLNRPETGNVVNIDNLELIYKCITEANVNPECRVIVVEGTQGVFSKGMDFKFMLEQSEDGIDLAFSEPYLRAVRAIRNSSKPVIAAIDGDVLAGGMGIALACDIVLATKRSRFGLSEVLFGIIPAYVFPFLLERVTLKTARFMVLSSQTFKAKDARRFGIVDDVTDDDRLEKTLTGYLKRILSSSPKALAITKSYSDTIVGKDLDEALAIAGEQLTALLNDDSNIAAIRGFMDGEKMPWMARYKRKKTDKKTG